MLTNETRNEYIFIRKVLKIEMIRAERDWKFIKGIISVFVLQNDFNNLAIKEKLLRVFVT